MFGTPLLCCFSIHPSDFLGQWRSLTTDALASLYRLNIYTILLLDNLYTVSTKKTTP